MTELTPDAVEKMKKAFLSRGGVVEKIPRGACRANLVALPDGPLKKKVLGRLGRDVMLGKLRAAANRKKLAELFDRRADRLEIFEFVFGKAASDKMVQNEFWLVVYQMRRFGIELPEYLKVDPASL